MKIGYARASTEEQPLDRQIDDLAAVGVDKRNIYAENVSGTKRGRPELNRMLAELQPGDIVLVTELSRLSRNLLHMIEISDIIRHKGAGFKSLKEGQFDTTTAQGKLLFGMMAVLAEWQRNMTSEQTKSGLKAAKARGRCGGRPSKGNEKADLVESLTRCGKGPTEIFNQLDKAISIATIKRIRKDMWERENKPET